MEPPHEPGLSGLLSRQFKRFATSVAIRDDECHLSYAQLHAKALNLVYQIRCLQVQPEVPIGILSPRGINHVVSQIAVIYAGATCVPLDVNHPVQYLANLLRNLDISILLTDKANSHRLEAHGFSQIVVDHRSMLTLVCEELGYDVIDLQPSQYRSHIFHTSGSTGRPKPVQVLARGIINYCLNETFVPVHEGQQFGHLSNVTFDVSIMETLGSFLRGATAVVLDRDTVLDPARLVKRIREDKIDVLWQTPALLATTINAYPQAYITVDTLLTGGEVVTAQLARKVLIYGPPKRLLNLYGPTECTMFSTFHNISMDDVERGNISIGKPMDGYEVIVVNDNLDVLPHGEVGELVIGGKGVAGGYLSESKKPGNAFIQLGHFCPNQQVYRTGDLGRWNSAGLLEFVGRRDNQVKIRGHRIELEAVEAILMATGLVSAAAAVKIDVDSNSDAESILLACVVPISEDTNPLTIRQAYTKNAPYLMLPRLEVVGHLPLTNTHKIDRRKLVEQYSERIGQKRTSPLHEPLSPIQQIVADVFGSQMGPEDNFFVMGGSSLHAARLVSRVKEDLGVQLRIAMVYEHPTQLELINLIESLQKGEVWTDKNETLWQPDLNLGKDMRPIPGDIVDWTTQSEGRVFLTGVTGFIGIFLLKELLLRSNVQRVACLVRATDELEAVKRILKALDLYGLRLSHMEKIWAIPGDFSKENLGLGGEVYDYFAEWASIIFHLGARVNWIEPYEAHRQANVLGLLNMIQFANTKRPKAIHYVSSTSVYGPTGLLTGATYIPEDENPESHLAALKYDTGYTQSKSVAEVIAWNAIANGLAVTIHRPGFVLGHSETGIGNSEDFFSRVVPSCVGMGCYPALSEHRDAFVSVDFVVLALLHIASSEKFFGRAYNLVEPHGDAVISLSEIFEGISAALPAGSLIEVPYGDWVGKCQSRTYAKTQHPLKPLMPMLEETVLDNKTRWELQARMPVVGTESLRNALRASPNLLCFPTIRTLLPKYIRYWLEMAERRSNYIENIGRQGQMGLDL
ncbi:NRPS-like enzyme [Aspergillus flavus]|nr:NRPS-like enzyme [Aspergillus flavus]